MRTKLPRRPAMDARMIFVVPIDLKHRVFAIAATKGRSAADLAREALAAIVRTAA